MYNRGLLLAPVLRVIYQEAIIRPHQKPLLSCFKNLGACIYVYMYAFMSTFMCVFMNLYIYLCMYVYIYLCI